jgi:hypothetical protein
MSGIWCILQRYALGVRENGATLFDVLHNLSLAHAKVQHFLSNNTYGVFAK